MTPFLSLSFGEAKVEWQSENLIDFPIDHDVNAIALQHRETGYQVVRRNCRNNDIITIYVVGKPFANEIKSMFHEYFYPSLNQLSKNPEVVFNGKTCQILLIDGVFPFGDDSDKPAVLLRLLEPR